MLSGELAQNWQGEAAGSYQGLAGRVAGAFAAGALEVGTAASLLLRYAGELEHLQSDARIAGQESEHWHEQITIWTGKFNDAQTALTRAQTDLSTAQGQYNAAIGQGPKGAGAAAKAGAAIARASADLKLAQADLDRARRQDGGEPPTVRVGRDGKIIRPPRPETKPVIGDPKQEEAKAGRQLEQGRGARPKEPWWALLGQLVTGIIRLPPPPPPPV